MKRLIIVALSLLPTFVFAQPIQQAQVAPQAELTFKVTPTELDLISEGLQTQPFGKVVPLINKLRQQIVDQQPKPAETPAVAPK